MPNHASRLVVERAPVIKVTVTEEHIKNGKRKSPGYCMLSKAAADAYPEGKFFYSTFKTIRITNLDLERRYTYVTPEAAEVALRRFDAGLEVKPFTFVLRGAIVHESGRRSGTSGTGRKTKRPGLFLNKCNATRSTRKFGGCYYTNDVSDIKEQP